MQQVVPALNVHARTVGQTRYVHVSALCLCLHCFTVRIRHTRHVEHNNKSVYTFCRLSVNMSKEDFILVPRSVNDITTEWCNEVLHCGKCISSETYVSQVKVENLTDGEGLSGAQMVRLQLTYRYLFSNISL